MLPEQQHQTFPVTTNCLVGKNTNGDFTVAYTSENTLTISWLPSYVTALSNTDIVSIYVFSSTGQLKYQFDRDKYTISVSWSVITLVNWNVATSYSFSATDLFVVYTNIPSAGSSWGGTNPSLMPSVYNACSFTLADSTSDYNVKTGVATSFSSVTKVGYLKLTSTKDITVKFNSAANSWYPVSAASFPLEITWLAISNLFLTNASGNSSTITILSY